MERPDILNGVEGYMYPNEMELQWSILIVLYPFITGLVAGAFILASLERVFKVEAVKPTYRLALLTALAFLLVAPLPLQLHLGHPERSLEMYLTPHTSSAMAMFGFVYLWYLMVVLLLEIWLDYRKDIVLAGAEQHRRHADRLQGPDAWAPTTSAKGRCGSTKGGLVHHPHRHPLRLPAPRLRGVHLRLGQGEPLVVHAPHAHRVPLLGHRLGHRPGAPHVHARRPGSRAARSRWTAWTPSPAISSTPSSSTSLSRCWTCIHRIYEADESFKTLDFMVHTRLYASQVIVQIVLGTAGAHRAPGLRPGGAAQRAGPAWVSTWWRAS